ncbi:hypothetical protein [Sphingomonas sp. UYP23]
MTARALLLREAAISAVINAALSIVFFILVFGISVAPRLDALGQDFLPQAFMVSLMGSLVPALLMRRQLGGAVQPIVVRAVVFALLGAAIAGGAAYGLCALHGAAMLPTAPAITIKALFGAVLGAIVAPLAVWPIIAAARHA